MLAVMSQSMDILEQRHKRALDGGSTGYLYRAKGV